MATNIKPLGARVLVEKAEVEEKTASGIIIPDSAKESQNRGKVLAIGKDVEDVKVGDTVLYGKYNGTEIKENDKEYMIINSEDLLAIV
jgi:chaperonin GroES